MKLTKFSHACIVLEQDGKKVIIDPGVFSEIPNDITHTQAIVITHVHPDHFDKQKIDLIVAANPDARIFTTSEVADQLQDISNVTEVLEGDIETVQGFELEFFGAQHAVIHADVAVNENIGVFINNQVYYPGDAFTLPQKPVTVLLVPTSAPWLKTSESMDFITEIKPQTVIPTHDAILSDAGKSIYDNWLAIASEKVSAQYKRLQPTESLDIS